MVKQHSSLPRCSTKMEKGLHRFTLEKYSLCKGIGHGKTIDSDAFTVGGHQWAVSFFPDGTTPQSRDAWSASVGLYVMLLSGTSKRDEDEGSGGGVHCFFQFTLLDQSGKGNHLRSVSNLFDKAPDTGPALLPTGKRVGYPSFIKRGRLEYGFNAAYLKDDCLKIECMIWVVLPSGADEDIPTGPRCVDDDDDNDDVGADFITLLRTGQGSDVVFDVRGKKFQAHKVMLSARSSVFESMFSDQQQQKVLITNTEPRVFEVLLHFIYSDTLPEVERALLVDGYAFGPSLSGTFGVKLLLAADEYDVVRLKTICQSHLWRTISLGRFAFILSIADRCNATVLKRLCFKFAADNYADLVELESFNDIRKERPLLQNEIDDYISKERHSKNEIKKEDSASKQKLSLLVDDC